MRTRAEDAGFPRRRPTSLHCGHAVEPIEPRVLLSTYVVINTADAGAGSLRQAILDANANAGADAIHFNIAPGGVQTIAPTSVLPEMTGPVTIDGTTQPGSGGRPAIELSGHMIPQAPPGEQILRNGLVFSGGGSTLRGLVVNRFPESAVILRGGGGNVVAGNYVGTDASGTREQGNGYGVEVVSDGNTVGGESAADRNVVSGNGGMGVLLAGNSNRVAGNFIGTDVTGAAAVPNTVGVELRGSRNTIGGRVAAARNVVSGNFAAGFYGFSGSTIGNVIEGNYVGTDAAGLRPVGNGDGFQLSGAENVIGGTVAAARNVIAGNRRHGVMLFNHNRPFGLGGDRVMGNYIGLNAAGEPLGNSGAGVLVDRQIRNVIGGLDPGAGNVIAHNAGDGVTIVESVVTRLFPTPALSNAVLGNSIHDNGGLGIDLADDGVTPNDPADSDEGPNRLQNFPTITRVETALSGRSTVYGTLRGAPGAEYRVELFSTPAADPSGHGEGATFLESSQLRTDASGNGTFSPNVPAVPAGYVVTATATDVDGNTSEFSPAVPVSPALTSAAFAYDVTPHAVRVAFNGDVSASLDASDLTVRNAEGGPVVTPSTVTWEAATRTATFRFASPLPDGNWQATIADGAVATAPPSAMAVDGDADGAPGGAFSFTFFALTGDVNRDRMVNGQDFALLASNFGRTGMSYAEGDLNGDGAVNGSDFAALAGNFGRSLPFWSSAAVGTATSASTAVASNAPKATAKPTPPASAKAKPTPKARVAQRLRPPNVSTLSRRVSPLRD